MQVFATHLFSLLLEIDEQQVNGQSLGSGYQWGVLLSVVRLVLCGGVGRSGFLTKNTTKDKRHYSIYNTAAAAAAKDKPHYFFWDLDQPAASHMHTCSTKKIKNNDTN